MATLVWFPMRAGCPAACHAAIGPYTVPTSTAIVTTSNWMAHPIPLMRLPHSRLDAKAELAPAHCACARKGTAYWWTPGMSADVKPMRLGMRAASLLFVLLLMPVAIACGSDEAGVRAPAVAGERVDRDRAVGIARGRGLTVQLPGGWSRAHESLTPSLIDPREVLSVATVPLRYRATECAHMAGAALEDLGPADAFITLQERGLDPSSTWPDFPPRPTRFGPELGAREEASACVPYAPVTPPR